MKHEVDLKYYPDSYVGPLDMKEVTDWEHYFATHEQPQIKFDPAYLRHLSKFHGGVPNKRLFLTDKGTEKVINRFLNFLDPVLLTDSVGGTWSDIFDRLSDNLMPFADLASGDFLCFDYEKGGRPQIVVWFHELSPPSSPYTEFVANNFDEFLEMLYEDPDDD